MKPLSTFVVLGLLLLGPARADAGEPHTALVPLAEFVGKTWRGEFSDSTAENPKIDVQHWEWALGGQAIRITHSINEGEYGGETMLVYDSQRDRLVYFYFTTGGFYTTGTMSYDDGAFVAYEEVTGGSDVTAVRSTGIVLEDGRLHAKAEYLRNGNWEDGHEIFYVEDPAAEVVFR